MIVKARAKINLALEVLDKRPDGYHNLDMVIVPLDLHDSIDISVLPGTTDSFITCDDVSLETGEYNLCSIALKAMRERYHFKQQFRIHIHKSIPMSAGLGGGSSDAAAVMHGICELLKIKPDPKEILDIARKIGSDVPFFYVGAPARVKGVGDIVEPLPSKPFRKYFVLLVKPATGLSTKLVYAKYDELGNVPHVQVDAVISALTTNDDAALGAAMANALEPAAFALLPEVEKLKKSLLQEGFTNVMMTGSGSSVFVLSDNLKKLTHVDNKYAKMGYTTVLTGIYRPDIKK